MSTPERLVGRLVEIWEMFTDSGVTVELDTVALVVDYEVLSFFSNPNGSPEMVKVLMSDGTVGWYSVPQNDVDSLLDGWFVGSEFDGHGMQLIPPACVSMEPRE